MAKLRGWLLYTQEDYARNASFAQRFLDKGNSGERTLELVFKDTLRYGISQDGVHLSVTSGQAIALPDFVINRTIDPLLSRTLEYGGVRVLNSSRIAEICNDKARTYLEVSRLGLPMVDTFFMDRQSLKNNPLPFSAPYVLKTVEGRGGAEVYLVRDKDEVFQILDKNPGQRYVAQRLCGDPGKDVRVFVVGKKIVGAVLRKSQGGFKANFTLGGTAEAYELNKREQAMVMRIIQHFDFDMVGIDFIFDEKGNFLFNEIEDVVGSRTLSITSDADIVSEYLEHIDQVMNGRRQP